MFVMSRFIQFDYAVKQDNIAAGGDDSIERSKHDVYGKGKTAR